MPMSDKSIMYNYTNSNKEEQIKTYRIYIKIKTYRIYINMLQKFLVFYEGYSK